LTHHNLFSAHYFKTRIALWCFSEVILTMASDEFKTNLVERVKQSEWYKFKPRLNYKESPLCSIPPTIDPKNWTEITPKELDLHQRRQEVRGRLRREFWAKRYHPQHWHHFNSVISDPAYTHYARATSVWHIKETMQMSRQTAMTVIGVIAIPTLYFLACFKSDYYQKKWESIVKS